jgi:hypothetical protein
VDVVRPRPAPAQELSARHTSLAAVLVTGFLEGGNMILGRCIVELAGRYVENRLGAHTWDRSTADVLEPERQAASVAYPLLFSGEEPRASSVILDEPDDTRLKTERVNHRYSLTDWRSLAAPHIEITSQPARP